MSVPEQPELTPEIEACLRDWRKGSAALTCEQIAARLGVTRGIVAHWLRELRLPQLRHGYRYRLDLLELGATKSRFVERDLPPRRCLRCRQKFVPITRTIFLCDACHASADFLQASSLSAQHAGR